MTKLFFFTTILLLLFLFSFYFNKNYQISKISEEETASTTSFKVDGPENFRTSDDWNLKLFSSTYMNTTNFIFQADDGGIVTTLSIDNNFVGPPTYKIVKGKSHDWLVVTVQGMHGSSIKDLYDNWYLVDRDSYEVLSYKSDGHRVPGPEYKNGNIFWNAEIMNDLSVDDTKVDVKTTYKNCALDEKWEPKDCEETSKIDNYVWDNTQGKFVGGTDDKILP